MWTNKILPEGLPFPVPCCSYIENQDEWRNARFGWHPGSNLGVSGCGILAAWNVLVDAGRITEENASRTMYRLIHHFGRFGAVCGGRLGVSVAALYFFFRRQFPKASLSFRHNACAQNAFGLRYDVFVATIVNDRRRPWKGLHTVCITKSLKGYVVHNAYRKNSGGHWTATIPFATLSEALSHITAEPFFVVVIGIAYGRKKEYAKV
ncbi:MAG: hypothetical protein IJ679_06255 [Lachnospiraceae bacterium]|nr:hypothetical protein [Lachnospiraceae bacterium]